MLESIEEAILQKLGWPSWAVRLIGCLSVLVLVTALIQQYILSKELQATSKRHKNENSTSSKTSFSFRIFQLQYLSVYLITMLADWLQGTNMYTLYTVSAYQLLSSFPSLHPRL